MTPLEHCPAGTWLPPLRTCVPFSSARPPSNEWWPGLFLWQHQATTKGHINHCFHLSSGDNFYNFYFTNQKLFQGVISEDKNLFKYYNTNFCKILSNFFFWGGGREGGKGCFTQIELRQEHGLTELILITHLEPLVFTAVDVLLVLCFPRCDKGWVFWPRGEGHPGII